MNKKCKELVVVLSALAVIVGVMGFWLGTAIALGAFLYTWAHGATAAVASWTAYKLWLWIIACSVTAIFAGTIGGKNY